MAVKRGVLLLITLFLASASLSLAYSRSERDLTEMLDQCLDRCQSRRSDSQRMLTCEGQCAHDYYKERQECEDEELTWDNPSIRPERFEHCQRQCQFEPRQQQRDCQRRCQRQQESSPTRPRQFEECERECQSEPMGQQKRECQRRCERQQENRPRQFEDCERECQFEPMGQQKRECQRRCERQQESFDPEERQSQGQTRVDRYKRCQRRCSEMGILQQVPCQTRCAAEFGLRDVEADNRRQTSPRRVEKCEKECQFEPRRQQGQCVSGCKRQEEMFPEEETAKLEKCLRRCADQGPLEQIECHLRCATGYGQA